MQARASDSGCVSDGRPPTAVAFRRAPGQFGTDTTRPAADRGQTTVDFGIGMSLFLVALLGVLLFVSGTMQPFTKGSQEDLGLADRVATGLSEGMLGDPARPHVLNATCTVAFFDDDSPDHCRHSGTNLTERVGVKPWQLLNVTVQADLTSSPGDETLCWDVARERVVALGSTDCSIPLSAGPRPLQRSGDVVTARRVVTINGTDATLRVEVW